MNKRKDPIAHQYLSGGMQDNMPSSLNELIEALQRIRVQVLKAGQDPDAVLLRFLDGADLDADIEALELAFFPDDEVVDLLVTFGGGTRYTCPADARASDLSPRRWLGREIVC